MAIQQHPLPQDISSYRFRLIGDMTLKQFASLGVCIVLAVIAYSLPLPFFFKYPLAFIFLLLGIGMAFVPVQGRSLDVWLIAFVKSIYSPTQFTWKRTPDTLESQESATPVQENNRSATPPLSSSIQNNTPTQTSPVSSVPPVQKEMPPTSKDGSEPKQPTSTIISSPEKAISQPVVSVVPTPPNQPSSGVIPPSTASSYSISQTPEKPNPTISAPTTNLPIPFTPTTPNTLVGLTLTPNGNILDGVLVEIKKDNLTLRATKSNKLGQFMFARPLESGLYQILAEKDTFHFAPYSLQLSGEIVKPLKIQAQN